MACILPAVLHAATYYASPNGSAATPCDASDPCDIPTWAAQINAGDTGILLNGTYQGADYMLDLDSTQIQGTSGARITIACESVGGCIFDGQGVNAPCYLKQIDYTDWSGFICLNTRAGRDTFELSTLGCSVQTSYNGTTSCGSDHNTYSYIGAWENDPLGIHNTSNRHVISHNGGVGNTFVNIACGGKGRKCLSSSFHGLQATVRNAVIVYDGYAGIGVKIPVDFDYHGFEATMENIIILQRGRFIANNTDGQWGFLSGWCVGGDDFTGLNYTNAGETRCDKHETHVNIMDLFLSGIYEEPTFHPGAGIFLGSASQAGPPVRLAHDYVAATNILTYIDPALTGPTNNTDPMRFAPFDGTGTDHLTANNMTEIGGQASSLDADWTITNRVDVANIASLPGNIYTSGQGAQFCKLSVNGVIGTQPMWDPHPAQAILTATMQAAGETPYDVTAIVETNFGPIPEECKVSGMVPTAPPGIILHGLTLQGLTLGK